MLGRIVGVGMMLEEIGCAVWLLWLILLVLGAAMIAGSILYHFLK